MSILLNIKKGFFYIYLLLFLHYKDQFLDVSKRDNIISVEHPDLGNNLQLFCIILLVIFHNPYRELNLNTLYINKSKNCLP